MARVRMVTRTITVTECECVFMDLVSLSPVIETVELTGKEYNELEAQKVLAKKLDVQYDFESGKQLKFVTVRKTTTREDIYGMLEEDFLKVAKKLDEDRKFLEDEE